MIVKIDSKIKKKAISFFTQFWGSDVMVTKGKKHIIGELPGYCFEIDSEIKGMITYNIANDECEIISLHTTVRNEGIGTKLLEQVAETAMHKNCKRLWLITTNDNTPAMRFFQKRGYTMKSLYHDSIQEARKIKPEIPLYGKDGIAICHEVEFEKNLNDKNTE